MGVPNTVYSGRNLNMGKINRLMISNRTAKVKISEISAPISITHVDDFTECFSLILIYLSECSLVKAEGLLTFFSILSQLLLSFFKEKLPP